jgi:hypothetical protein
MRRVAGSEDQPGKSFRLAGFEFPVSSWWNSISRPGSCELEEAYSSRYFEVNPKSCLKNSKTQRAKSEGSRGKFFKQSRSARVPPVDETSASLRQLSYS